MANRSGLGFRVSAVLDTRQRRGRAGRFIVALGCAAAAVLAFTISPLRTVSSSPSAAAQAATDNPKAMGEPAPVSEGPLFRLSEIQFVNAHVFPSSELRKYFPVRDGDPFNLHAIREGIEAMTWLYGQHGYLNFTASPDIGRDHKRELISVALDIDEGQQFRVGSVQVIGLNRPLSGDTLKTRLRPGEVFNCALVGKVFEENRSILPADASPRHDLLITQNSKNATVAIRLDFRRYR